MDSSPRFRVTVRSMSPLAKMIQKQDSARRRQILPERKMWESMREPAERMKSFPSGFQSPKTRRSLRRKAKLEVSQQGVSYVNISHPYEPSSSLNSPRRIRQHEKVLMEAANELAQCRQQIKTYNSLPHVLRRVIYADIVNQYPRTTVISPNLLVFETRLKRKKQRGIQTDEEAAIINYREKSPIKQTHFNTSVIPTFRVRANVTSTG